MRFPRSVGSLSVALALVTMLSPRAWSEEGSSKYPDAVMMQKAAAKSQQSALVTTALGNNLYLFSGDGATVIAVADDNSVLLINSGMADRVTELAHTVYEAVQRPVTTLVNTDWHFDHTGGNQYFSSFGVTIIAQANTKKRIAAEHKSVRKTYAANNPSSFNVVASPWAAAVENPASERYALRGIPTVAFDESMTINLDNEELIFCHYGAGHTDGDTVVFFQTSNLVLLGDIFPGHEYPWIDVRSGGSLAGVIQTVDRVLSASNEQTRIIPGQGPVLHKAELQDYRNMLVNIQARIQELLESGASADQIIAAAPTSDFDSEWGGGDVSGQVFTSLIIESMAQGR